MPEKSGEIHKIVGYLPQNVAFQEWRTVNHALSTFGELSGIEKNELENSVGEVLDLLDLSEVRHKKISELSGGTLRKVGLAQALLHNPKLLILDEPLAGLDPANRYHLKKIIKDLNKRGTTIFFSSHILSDVGDIATRIGIINMGSIMRIGTLNELKADFSISQQIGILLSGISKQWKRLEALDGVAGVTKIEQSSSTRLLVTLDGKRDVADATHNIIRELMRLDCKIYSINPIAPNLDEIYLRYVSGGKHR